VDFQPADDRALLSLFDDLEQQAQGLALAQRDGEVLERLRDEYAEVDLLSRWHASVGREVVVSARGAGDLQGVLGRVGADWCLLERTGWGPAGARVLVQLPLVTSVRGLADSAQPAAARPVLARLRLTACLRRLAESGETHTLRLADGTVRTGCLGRVGSDFVEVWGEGATVVVPLRATSCVVSGVAG
jgi:hypothetical protein